MLEEDLLQSDAWRSLSPAAVWSYIELRRKYNGMNNGDLSLTFKEVSWQLAPGTYAKALRELQRAGLIAVTQHGGLYKGCSLYRLSQSWKLPDIAERCRKSLPLRRMYKDIQKVERESGVAVCVGQAENGVAEGVSIQKVKRSGPTNGVGFEGSLPPAGTADKSGDR